VLTAETIGCRPGAILVPVRDIHNLTQLEWALDQPETADRDVVVLTVRLHGAGAKGRVGGDLFGEYEQRLFTRCVAIAERHGRGVTLLVAAGVNNFDVLAQSAARLGAGTIVVGRSEVMSPERQALLLGEAWDRTSRPSDEAADLVVLGREGATHRFALGAHAPALSSGDVERIHPLWIEAVQIVGPSIHHRDVVVAALANLEDDLHGAARDRAVATLRAQVTR
jgi:hypothetical protein